MESFQTRLLFIRTSAELTQKQMAKRLKLTPAHISNLENGRRDPSDIVISAICNEFNVNENWLRKGIGEPYIDTLRMMQRTFASFFLQITKSFSPVFSSYGEMMPIFENEDMMRMFNYLALRVKRGGFGKRNIDALMSSFDASFPGFADVIKSLERDAEATRGKINSSKIARSLMPVHGMAAAGPPLYDDSINGDSIEVPVQYCSDRFFVVRVKGDSMAPNINDGDHVVVARRTDPENGSLALVYIADGIGEEYVIKLFHRTNQHVELQSYNPEYDPIILPLSKIESAEKIVHVIHL